MTFLQNLLIALALFGTCHFLVAQNNKLIGRVTYQNTGEPVGLVEINEVDATNQCLSNEKTGRFELTFETKRSGAAVSLEIFKAGYVNTNKDIVKYFRIPDKPDRANDFPIALKDDPPLSRKPAQQRRL